MSNANYHQDKRWQLSPLLFFISKDYTINYTDKDAIERIAKAYAFSQDALPDIRISDIHNMRKLIQAQFAYLSEKVYFDFVKADPYLYVKIEELDADWRNGIVKVNTTGNESELWGSFI